MNAGVLESVRPYVERFIFTTKEVDLLRRATHLVALISDASPEIRCHELARFVGAKLGLQVQDGYFGFVEHSWLWVGTRESDWDLPNILDVYVPGALPQVQLLHVSSALPMPYRIGLPRDDIRQDVIDWLARSGSATRNR